MADETETREEFQFMERDGKLIAVNTEKQTSYVIDPNIPSCTCPDFQFRRSGVTECKHIREARDRGYAVKEAEPPVTAPTSLVPTEEERGITIEGEYAVIPFSGGEKQVMIPKIDDMSEEKVISAVKNAFGESPNRDEVLERIPVGQEATWDIKGEATLPLAKRLGVEVFPVKTEEVKKEMQIEAGMPPVEVTATVRVNALALWRGQDGDPHIGWGEKEEFLTKSRWNDYQRRGSNFLVDIATTKAMKKALFRSLPFTKSHLLNTIFSTFGWTRESPNSSKKAKPTKREFSSFYRKVYNELGLRGSEAHQLLEATVDDLVEEGKTLDEIFEMIKARQGEEQQEVQGAEEGQGKLFNS